MKENDTHWSRSSKRSVSMKAFHKKPLTMTAENTASAVGTRLISPGVFM